MIIILDLFGILFKEIKGTDGHSSGSLQMFKTLRVLRFARLFRLRRVLLQARKHMQAGRTRKRAELTYKVSMHLMFVVFSLRWPDLYLDRCNMRD